MTGFDSKRQAAMDKLVATQEALGMYDDQKPEPHGNRPLESDYNSQVAYTRALEAYCDSLAQPEQEPVAWRWKHGDSCWQLEDKHPRSPTAQPLYTTPPQRPWVGLTDGHLADIWYKESLDWMEFARAHEAALRSKNFG